MILLQRAKVWLLPETVGAVYDRQLLMLSFCLMFIGLIMVASASIPEGIAISQDPMMFVKRHSVFLVACLIAGAVVVKIPVSFWQKHSGNMLMLAIFLLLAVLIVGRSVNGAVRWINLGPVGFQPAEFAKLALLVYLAGYLVRRQQEVQETLKGFFKPLFVLFVLAALLLAQPDLGSVVVMMVTTIGMLFLAGAKLGQFIGILITGISAVILLIVVEPYRMRRVTSFLDPWDDPFGSGYQLTQSLMAFGRGSWFGEGLGNSIQKLEYLPEAHTDFVFAILAEELGFIGVTLVLCLLFWLAFKALVIGKKALLNNMLFEGYLAMGIGIWFSFQTAVNVGAAVGMLPTKGLTLPLVSYGGTSLVIMATAVALLLRIDFELRQAMTQARERVND